MNNLNFQGKNSITGYDEYLVTNTSSVAFGSILRHDPKSGMWVAPRSMRLGLMSAEAAIKEISDLY